MNGRTGADGAGTGPSAPLRLHAAMQRVRAFDARRPRVWDALLAALIAAPGIGQIADGDAGRSGLLPDWEGDASAVHVPVAVPWLAVAGLVLPLLWRRRRPLAAFCVISAVLVVHDAYDLALTPLGVVSIGFALYNVALRSPLSRLAWVGVVIFATAAHQAYLVGPQDVWRDYVPFVAVVTAIVTAGIAARSRREYVAALVDRAATAERSRIAREMHDIIAHNLSVIVGLADGGAYAAARTPERSGQALEAIARTGREALRELRRLLGVLQQDAPVPAMRAPQPDLTELEPLLDRVRAAGPPVRCTVAGAAAALCEGRQLTVYRLVQEALTNTLKHAGPGAHAEVSVVCAPEGAVDITITDVGGRSRPADGGGQGIQGMRERAAVYDGAFEAGADARSGGWRVRCTLPARRRAPEETTV